MHRLGNFYFKINALPNGLGKYTSSSLDRKLVFIDRFQFLSSSIYSLFKTFRRK